MKFDIFLNKSANLIVENRALKLALFVIALSNILFGWMAYRAVKYEKVVLIPFGLQKKVIVQGDKINEGYLLQLARFVFDLALDFSPALVKSQYDLLLSDIDPSTYDKYRRRFQKLVEEAETGKLISVFVIRSLEHDPEKHLVIARGDRAFLLEGTRIVEKKRIAYAFIYTVRGGRVFIKEIGELKCLKDKLEGGSQGVDKKEK